MSTNLYLYPNKKDINKLINFINPLQKTIVLDESRIILLNGCAGSRKTDTIIKKGLNYICTEKNILFLTFVSSVSNEIKTRIEQTLNITIPKIGSSNHYLAQYDNNYIEIANIDAWIHKQLSWVESNFTNNTSNKKKELSINFNNKVLMLQELTSKYKYYNIILKNNMVADYILIDEFQDTDINKVELIIDFIKNNQKLGCVVAGDILQTIFVDNIGCKNFKNPMEYFKIKLEPKYYQINTCFRCPESHIKFVNYLLGDYYKSNGLELIVPQNIDNINKPVLFGHDCISHNESAYKLAIGISNTIISILKLDNQIKPDDIAIIMKKSNSNYVYEHLKDILPKLLKKNNIYPSNQSNQNNQSNQTNQTNLTNSYIVHFETNGDGYSNTINWEKSKDKIVLVSIHGDKGKGHKVVFFLGLSKKSIPIDYNIGKPYELFDISLLNVALTRSLKYLFVGFTFNSPSIYLSAKQLDLDKYCYLSWDKDIYNKLTIIDKSLNKSLDKNLSDNPTTDNFNKLNYSYKSAQIYIEAIKKLNECWFDKLSCSKQKPKFEKTILTIPNLPIKTTLKVSQDISKDLSLYIEKIIPDLIIEEDCVDLYETININIPETFYPILGFVGELLLMRNHMIQTNNYGYLGWGIDKKIYYTDSDTLINFVYDYKLNKFINDIGLWKDKLLEIELDFLIFGNPEQIGNKDFLVTIQQMQNYTCPVIILGEFYHQYNFEKIIQNFCSNLINSIEFCKDPKSIIILSLFYAEINSDVRKDFLHLVTQEILLIKNIDKIILQIVQNSNYIWNNFLSGNFVEYQKNISIEKKLFDKKILKSYGFTYKNDRNIFKKGLGLSIGGICDVFNQTTNTLFEIKTCLKTSFSNEWVLQIVVYNLLLKITNQLDIKNNYIANLFDGSIYKINFTSDTKILKSILKFYEFDDYLMDFIIKI